VQPEIAFEMGYRSAAAGFFFDGMELIAALAPALGGVDALRGGVELLFAVREQTNDDTDFVASLCSRAFNQHWPPPRGVDAYRHLLTTGVFEIVNRWSYIDDIKQVNRLQAWFYAGFGLGRGETVARGLALLIRLRDIAGADAAPLPQTPESLRRMSAEAAKQMATASAEDDLRAVRPLFEDSATRLQSLALALQAPLEQLVAPATFDDDLAAFVSTASRVRLDFRTTAAIR
jgi:hypothetical protein